MGENPARSRHRDTHYALSRFTVSAWYKFTIDRLVHTNVVGIISTVRILYGRLFEVKRRFFSYIDENIKSAICYILNILINTKGEMKNEKETYFHPHHRHNAVSVRL